MLHFLAVWMSVATSLMAGWSVPLRPYISLPLGVLIWLLGFFLNLRIMETQRRRKATHSRAHVQQSYRRIAARTLMNLGIALGFRSWLTMVIACILIPFYLEAAKKRRMYLDYLRTGMLRDAFPNRIPRK
ncbi:hypothetical protein [Candidatus Solincola sp.]|nr:hypothetical protein [Actinomycetota bacterium]